MKHMRSLLLLAVVVGLALSIAAIVHAGGRGGCPGDGSAALLKDAKFEVSNIANGVAIRITSGKPEVVKVIQARFASFGEGRPACHAQAGQSPCGHTRGSEACQKAHEAGQCQHECGRMCPGHQTGQ